MFLGYHSYQYHNFHWSIEFLEIFSLTFLEDNWNFWFTMAKWVHCFHQNFLMENFKKLINSFATFYLIVQYSIFHIECNGQRRFWEPNICLNANLGQIPWCNERMDIENFKWPDSSEGASFGASWMMACGFNTCTHNCFDMYHLNIVFLAFHLRGDNESWWSNKTLRHRKISTLSVILFDTNEKYGSINLTNQ